MGVKTINSVRNALAVLEALARAQPVGVSALARTVGLDKATVQRILVTLDEAGWIRRTVEGEWLVTSRALQVGAHSTAALRELARPHLVALQRDTGETALLFAREHDALVLVDSVDSEQALRMTVPLGTVVPIQPGGGLAAWLPTARGPADAAARRRGWFIVDQLYPSSIAAGAPILDDGGQVVAALVVVGPKVRVSRAAARRIAGRAHEAAATISSSRDGVTPRAS